MASFFIVGAQRSGSTLLRLILNAHSEIAVPEEARFLVPLLKERYVHTPLEGARLKRVVDYITHHPQFALWNYDPRPFIDDMAARDSIYLRDLIARLYTSFCAAEGKSTWGDKSLFFQSVPVLSRLFPEARFLHIVRDGRDVFHSWRRLDPTKGNPAVIALDWSYKLRTIESDFESIDADHHLTIRYEDLIADPQKTLREVTSFLGVAFDPGMLEFHKTSHRYIGDHHSELIFSPISNTNAEKWRKNLTPAERRVFDLVGRRTLERFGYDVAGDTSAGDAVRAAGLLVAGLPARFVQVLRTKLVTEKAARTGEITQLEVGDMPRERRDEEADAEQSGGR